MNQKSFQAITTMLNSFPQSPADLRALLLTYDQALDGVSDKAIEKAALAFISGQVEGQNKTFAPSVAEFCSEARRTPYLVNRQAPVSYLPHKHDDPSTRVRMGFKMAVLSASIGMGKVDLVADANRRGLDDIIALGQQWGVPVPEEIWAQRQAKKSA